MRLVWVVIPLVLVVSIIGIVGIQESFATEPTGPLGYAKLEISDAPKLHEEFELIISLIPFNYNEDWEKDSRCRS